MQLNDLLGSQNMLFDNIAFMMSALFKENHKAFLTGPQVIGI